MPSKRCATSAKTNESCSSALVTNGMACQSRCEIQVQASHRRLLSVCSRPSTPRNRTVWGSGCRSAVRLSKRITDNCGRGLTCRGALSMASLSRLIRPPHPERSAGDASRGSALGDATWAARLCQRQLQLVGHARQIRQGRCLHLAHDLATVNFYCDLAYAEVGGRLFV